MPASTATAAPQGEVIEGLTPGESRHLAALEKRIQKGMTTFREVGEALLEIRDNRLYRQTHASFDAYCRDRFSLDRGRVYQLMGAATVAEALPAGAAAMGEGHLRLLVPIFNADPKAAVQVWSQIEKTARDEARPITMGLIREVVHQAVPRDGRNGGEPSALADLPAQTRSVVVAMRKATASIKDWPQSKPSRNEKKAVREAVQELLAAISAANIT